MRSVMEYQILIGNAVPQTTNVELTKVTVTVTVTVRGT